MHFSFRRGNKPKNSKYNINSKVVEKCIAKDVFGLGFFLVFILHLV